MNVIECRNVSKVYFRKKVLDHMNFTIVENKITGLIGRNGVGKTTLLKMIAGFIKHSNGEIKVFDQSPFNNLIVSANTIFVDDQMTFPSALQLREILEEGERFYPNWDHQLAQSLLKYFQFDPTSYHNTLSKGRTSTFNMIVGLASHCPLTIFDEPTTGMDEVVRKDFYRALLKDYIAHPRTIIISSHHLSEIEDLIEDVLLIKKGKVELHVPITELKEWGIGLTGQETEMEKWIMGRNIIHQRQISKFTKYVVVEDTFTQEDKENMILSGIEISPVRPSDLCVYITNETKGGIDDVFINREIS